MAKSLRVNIAFSFLLTAANYVFPFIVYPYVARVLGPENLGACNYVDGIVNYACALSLMGTGVAGVRMVSKYRDCPGKLSEGFTAIMSMSALFTVVASVLLLIATRYVPQRELMIIGQLKLWSSFFLIEWLYKGLERFRYITMRAVFVKIAYVVAVFAMVKTKSDYLVYFLLLALADAVNSCVNCIKASGIVSVRFSRRAFSELWRPFLLLGAYVLLNSMYTTFNVVYLGMVSAESEVGYYSLAAKVIRLALAMYTAYSVVVLPRACSLLSCDRRGEFEAMTSRSVDGLMLIAVPAVVFGMLFCPGIIAVMGGAEYAAAVMPMMIVMPLLFVIGYEQILVVQILMPLGNDRVILANSVIGALVGVIGNLLLAGPYGAAGSAVVWLVAELMVLVCSQYFVRRYAGMRFAWKPVVKSLLAYLPYAVVCFGVICLPVGNEVAKALVGAAMLVPYFIFVQLCWLRNPLLDEALCVVRKYFKR